MKPRTALKMLTDGARQIVGGLHPDQRDEYERQIRDARAVLLELIRDSEPIKLTRNPYGKRKRK